MQRKLKKDIVMEVIDKYKDDYYLTISHKPNGTTEIFIGTKRTESEDKEWRENELKISRKLYYRLVRGFENKMKRCEFFIIYNTDTGVTVIKTKGYMFQKCGHWFTVRRRTSSEKLFRKKWIISDFVTGAVMTDTDNKIEYIPSVVSEIMVARLLELYRDNTSGIYTNRSIREEMQSYAQMIHMAMIKNNPESNLLELHQSQAGDLFN